MDNSQRISVSSWAARVPNKIMYAEVVHSMTNLLGMGAALRCAGKCEKKWTSLDLVDLQ